MLNLAHPVHSYSTLPTLPGSVLNRSQFRSSQLLFGLDTRTAIAHDAISSGDGQIDHRTPSTSQLRSRSICKKRASTTALHSPTDFNRPAVVDEIDVREEILEFVHSQGTLNAAQIGARLCQWTADTGAQCAHE